MTYTLTLTPYQFALLSLAAASMSQALPVALVSTVSARLCPAAPHPADEDTPGASAPIPMTQTP